MKRKHSSLNVKNKSTANLDFKPKKRKLGKKVAPSTATNVSFKSKSTKNLIINVKNYFILIDFDLWCFKIPSRRLIVTADMLL
jgi:hypothetical protein